MDDSPHSFAAILGIVVPPALATCDPVSQLAYLAKCVPAENVDLRAADLVGVLVSNRLLMVSDSATVPQDKGVRRQSIAPTRRLTCAVGLKYERTMWKSLLSRFEGMKKKYGSTTKLALYLDCQIYDGVDVYANTDDVLKLRVKDMPLSEIRLALCTRPT